MEYLKEEVPIRYFVAYRQYRKREDKDLIDVHATIYCERSPIKVL